MQSSKKGISYASTGVDYSTMDPVKKLAQEAGEQTAKNLEEAGFKEIHQSRGETAFVWEQGSYYMAHVLECLGSKNLVADEVRKFSGKTHYDAIAQDTVATAVNDLVAVGAKPLVVNAYFSLGDSNWLNDQPRTADLISGWANACNLSGATWGGGETPTIKGVTFPETINLAASCVGIINPKTRLVLGEKLSPGDRILLVESSGIHANGVSLARAIAAKLPEGYATKLSDGVSFGETLLAPTYLYAKLVQDIFELGIDIHYMVNVTGHGWRKLMRASKSLSYVLEQIPPVQGVFDFIQQHCGNSDEEMYSNFNMGTGFAIFVKEADVDKVISAGKKNNLKVWNAGFVQDGEKQVVIGPKKIVFKGDSFQVR